MVRFLKMAMAVGFHLRACVRARARARVCVCVLQMRNYISLLHSYITVISFDWRMAHTTGRAISCMHPVDVLFDSYYILDSCMICFVL